MASRCRCQTPTGRAAIAGEGRDNARGCLNACGLCGCCPPAFRFMYLDGPAWASLAMDGRVAQLEPPGANRTEKQRWRAAASMSMRSPKVADPEREPHRQHHRLRD